MADDKGDHNIIVPGLGLDLQESDGTNGTDHDPDPHFEPIISLPEVPVSTMEEDEVEMVKLRAKLFRYDTREAPPEWKERGTGDIKLLRHTVKNCCRVVMRRDKTFKICANHYITPWMELKPNCGSDRAWVYSVPADYADEQIRAELLAVKFANVENARKWKDTFEEAKHIVNTQCSLYTKDGPESDSGDEDSDFSETEENAQKDEDHKVEDTKIAEDMSKELEKLKVDDDTTKKKENED